MRQPHLNNELVEIKALYSEVIFALEEINAFVDNESLASRKYIKHLPTLKNYKEQIEKIVSEEHRKGTLKRLLTPNKEAVLSLQNFKENKEGIFMQVKACTECKCFKCCKNCKMEGCNRCESNGKVSFCDNETAAVYTFKNKTIELRNNKAKEINSYNVLGIVEDLECNQFFKIMELKGQKYVVYFYPKISGDSYGEIKDAEDFNFAIKDKTPTLESTVLATPKI